MKWKHLNIIHQNVKCTCGTFIEKRPPGPIIGICRWREGKILRGNHSTHFPHFPWIWRYKLGLVYPSCLRCCRSTPWMLPNRYMTLLGIPHSRKYRLLKQRILSLLEGLTVPHKISLWFLKERQGKNMNEAWNFGKGLFYTTVYRRNWTLWKQTLTRGFWNEVLRRIVENKIARKLPKLEVIKMMNQKVYWNNHE